MTEPVATVEVTDGDLHRMATIVHQHLEFAKVLHADTWLLARVERLIAEEKKRRTEGTKQ